MANKMALKNTKDHWAFLEEIEAPMWVDFSLGARSNYQDIDDGWFHTSHPFHQCSSHQLKAAFAHSGEGSMSSHFDLKGPSSPKLPSSVSRSRGKNYASKKWRGDDCDLSLDKQHPVKVLNGKSSWVNSGSGYEIKPKLSFVNSKGTSKSKISLVPERGLTGNGKENDFKTMAGQEGLESSVTSMVDKAGESNTSTVTSESDRQPEQRNLEVSSQAFGQTSGLLSAVRISLRKSCVTRQASRMEINNDIKKSRDRKSSSSKSSVGSSSNLGYDVKSSTFTLMGKNEQTPDSRNVARMTEAAKNKVKNWNVSKGSNFQVKEGVFNSRRGGRSTVTKSAHQECVKSKVQNQTSSAKALPQHRVEEQSSLAGTDKAKEKPRVGGPNRLVGLGKENATGKTPVSPKCSSGHIVAGGLTKCQKGTKQNLQRKGDRTGLVGKKGKICGPSEVKYPTSVTQRVYLR